MSFSNYDQPHSHQHPIANARDRMRLDIWFLALALLLMLSGEVLGLSMRAHVNNLGWACFALFGLIHRAYPVLEESSLALPQFLLAAVSSLFLSGGQWMIWALGDSVSAMVGSYGLIAATLLFVVMFYQRVVFVPHAE